jgi:hypothetical protein
MRHAIRALPVRRAAACLAALLLPATLAAQQHLPRAIVNARAVEEATALHERATAIQHGTFSPRQGLKAAAMHEKAAKLRGETDAHGYKCLQQAAMLRYGQSQRTQALALLERAATLAAEHGDVIFAANTFTDAGVVAVELRDAERWRALDRRAGLLATSPLLTEEQRRMLRHVQLQNREVAQSRWPELVIAEAGGDS